MQKLRFAHYLLIPVAAFLALVPFIVWGTSCGHDFGFHLRNWLEVSSQWKQGQLFPQWAFTAAWNSGEPRFVFYPPISWVTGAALGLFLPWVAVPAAFIWIALTASGFTMHRLASQWTSSGNALIAACLYMVNPYMLFTMYERAAYAELLAAAWIPLLLLGILRPRTTVHGIAIPVCVLWLTNAPAAVMGCYSLALVGLIRVVVLYKRGPDGVGGVKEAAKISAGAVLGIGLAAFYVLPATVEQRWIKMQMPFLRGVRYQDNFAFSRIGDASHDAILRTASLCGVALVLLSAIFVGVALWRVKRDPARFAAGDSMESWMALDSLMVLACAVAFLLTAPSAFLWRHLPELKYLQFPWRFCTVLGATTAAFLALALRRWRGSFFVGAAVALTLTLIFTFGGNRFFRQPYLAAFAVPGIVQDFSRGGQFDPTDEYTPAGADPFALDHANPMFWIAARATNAAPQTEAGYSMALAKRLHFNVWSATPGFLVLSLRDYPAWRITVDGRPGGERPHRKDGLIALAIPSGSSTIDIAYIRTRDQIAGWIVSVLSGVALVLLWWKYDHIATMRPRSTILNPTES